MELSIRVREVEVVTCLELTGKLVFGEACTVLRDQVKQLLAASKKKVLLDLTKVTHLDSSGLSAVLDAFLSVRKQGGQLALLIVPATAEKLHRIYGPLIEQTYTNAAEALASLR